MELNTISPLRGNKLKCSSHHGNTVGLYMLFLCVGEVKWVIFNTFTYICSLYSSWNMLHFSLLFQFSKKSFSKFYQYVFNMLVQSVGGE